MRISNPADNNNSIVFIDEDLNNGIFNWTFKFDQDGDLVKNSSSKSKFSIRKKQIDDIF